MMKRITTLLCACALVFALPVSAFARELTVGGSVVGIEMKTRGVVVAGLTEVDTAEGVRTPAGDAGFRPGDVIGRIGQREIGCAADFLDAVAALEGRPAEVEVTREEKSLVLTVQPVLSAQGQWMLGMWLREGMAGIGTLTFYDAETGVFGALGHAVSDENSGAVLPLGEGSVTEAEIVDVTRGLEGAPGELNGCADESAVLGSIETNCDKGIYGTLYADLGGETVLTGEIRPGPAEIRCTVAGREIASFRAEINRVWRDGGEQRVTLTVTDPALCELTGGIVQGMSGSPILQNGRLVGAVTHVFVNDPTRGYGLGIDEMLRAAGLSDAA